MGGIMTTRADFRTNNHLRSHIEAMISCGFSISGRDPVRLERGTQVYEVRGKLLIQVKP